MKLTLILLLYVAEYKPTFSTTFAFLLSYTGSQGILRISEASVGMYVDRVTWVQVQVITSQPIHCPMAVATISYSLVVGVVLMNWANALLATLKSKSNSVH